MGLFDKKTCDICGEKIGLLGNRKLEDGNMCKDCTKKLSPFFSDRRSSTIAEIKDQLAYREENKKAVATFNVTRTLGGNTKVLLDEDAGKFIVTYSRKWQEDNPDVIDFTQVTGCEADIRENKTELKREGKDGFQESYNPPRYEYDYDFYVIIHVNSQWFDEIEFRVNTSTVDRRGSTEYREAEEQAKAIQKALTEVRESVRESVAAAKTSRKAQQCPSCGASVVPDENGCCTYCGGSLEV